MTKLDALRERQEVEVEALKAIYESEFRDCRVNDVWKVDRPPEIELTLRPCDGQTSSRGPDEGRDESFVVLHLKFPQEYPVVPVVVSLAKVVGMEEELSSQLLKEVLGLSLDLKGEEMCMELAQHTREFLYKHRKPKTGAVMPSFFEQMTRAKVQKQADEEHTKLEARQVLAEQEAKAINDEVKRRQKDKFITHDDTVIESHRGGRSSSVPNKHPPSPLRQGSEEPQPQRPGRNQSESESVTFKNGSKLVEIKPEGQFYEGSFRCLSGTLTGFEGHAHAAMMEWTIGKRKVEKKSKIVKMELDNIHKQLETIQRDIHPLTKLHHGNLLSYLFCDVAKDTSILTVRLVREHFVGDVQMSSLLASDSSSRTDRKMDEKELSLLSSDILKALQYLHSKSVVHRFVCLDFIWKRIYPEVPVYYLSDYGITKRVFDIYSQYRVTKSLPIGSPDYTEPVLAGLGRPSQRSDIFMFGIAVLSLKIGTPPQDFEPKSPPGSSTEFKDFLEHCIDKVEGGRWTATGLLSHQFVSEKFRRHSEKVVEPPPPATIDSGPEDGQVLPLRINPGFSRLEQEFDTLQWLGKGGFGDVIKVRNRLDGQIYAMKRVLLNPQSKVLNKKITREVKLLSRLNHENVVRYYNSWIETCYVADMSTTTDSLTGTETKEPKATADKAAGDHAIEKCEKSLVILKAPKDPFADADSDSVEKIAPPVRSQASAWSTSYGESKRTDVQDTDSDSDSDSEVFGVFGPSFYPPEPSEQIIFEDDNRTSQETETSDEAKERKGSSEKSIDEETNSTENEGYVQILFIQMEFCEKSTLRQAIDDGELCANFKRAWRLFREILEGLVHIHQQGMIHRDVKPVNIFLDSFDHVKIGDFGLATHDLTELDAIDLSASADTSGLLTHGSLDMKHTGHVGTALYVAPELVGTVQGTTRPVPAKLVYTQKVDIYSLGIILFEIFYKPLGTGMERLKILTVLRTEDVVLPEDFLVNPELRTQAELVRQLLSHDPNDRPSSEELLASPYIPQAEMEDREFHNTISTVLASKQTRKHRRLMRSLFERDPDAVQRYLYDDWMYKTTFDYADAYYFTSTEGRLVDVLKSYGFQHLSGPTLLPWDSKFYDGADLPHMVMDSDGIVLATPYDLRSTFARMVARKGISSIRRFDIGRVYRRYNASRETHPREVTEAAFDIVTASSPAADILAATAQCLQILSDVVGRFPAIDAGRCRIRLNHLALVKAILLYAGVEKTDTQIQIMQVLADSRLERLTRPQKMDRIKDLGVNEHMLKTIMKFMDMEDEFSRLSNAFRTITSRKHSEAADLAKMALKECDTLLRFIRSAKIGITISFAPGFIYNVHQFLPNLIFQLICSPLQVNSRRKSVTLDVLAMGGRYDQLIERYDKPQLSGKYFSHSAVGASVAVDRLVQARKLELEESTISELTVDVVICSIAGKSGEMLEEKLRISKELHESGLRHHYIATPVEDLTSVKDSCRKAGAKFLVMLKDTDSATCRVRRFNTDRLVERDTQVEISDLIGYLQGEPSDSLEAVRAHSSHSVSEGTAVPTGLRESHVSAILTFQFFSSEKLAFNTSKRLEKNITNNLSNRLTCFSPKETVHVLALECPGNVIKHIIAHCDIASESIFRSSFGSSIQAFGKYKRLLVTVMDAIVELRFDAKKPSVIVLCSYIDDVYRVMI